jgi:excinuclease ABC subunit C
LQAADEKAISEIVGLSKAKKISDFYKNNTL